MPKVRKKLDREELEFDRDMLVQGGLEVAKKLKHLSGILEECLSRKPALFPIWVNDIVDSALSLHQYRACHSMAVQALQRPRIHTPAKKRRTR